MENKEFKGTRGAEWVVQNEDNGIHTIWMEMTPEDMPTLVARTCYAPQSEANAHLIAAAPDLLEALQEAVNDLEISAPITSMAVIQKARAAINTALNPGDK